MINKNTIKIDRILANISKQLTLDILKPLNLEDEKKKFQKFNNYNPQFIYPDLDKKSFKKYYRQLKYLRFKFDDMGKIFKKMRLELFYRLKMFEHIGKKSFTKYSIKVYGKPDAQLLNIAKKLTKLNTRKIIESSRSISSYNAVKIFKAELKKLKFDWKVELSDIIAMAQVLPSRKKFLIKNNSTFSKKHIKRLIAHEIYTHILRSECGRLQPYKLFSSGLDNYESTEEGLALYKEKIAGVLDKHTTLKGYAGRVLAINVALNNSFRKTYQFLSKIYPKEKAWHLTVRVKRGIKDTSQPGAFTKDLIYLRGFLEVDKFIKNRSSFNLLHYGKIGISHVNQIINIEGLKDPKMLLKLSKTASSKDFNRLMW